MTPRRTAISLAIEFDTFTRFLSALHSYRDNDDEIPAHAPGSSLFDALAQGVIPNLSVKHLGNVLAALDRLRTEPIPLSWSLEIGQALRRASPREQNAASNDRNYERTYGRLAALARFEDPLEWTKLWGDSDLGRTVFGEIAMQRDTIEWALPAEVAERVLANIAVLGNMLADGVDLAELGCQYGRNHGTHVPLLHAAASHGNVHLAAWLLDAGMNPMEKIEDPETPGATIDAFDAARRFASPVLQLLQSQRARDAMRLVHSVRRPPHTMIINELLYALNARLC